MEYRTFHLKIGKVMAWTEALLIVAFCVAGTIPDRITVFGHSLTGIIIGAIISLMISVPLTTIVLVVISPLFKDWFDD
jgi:hypothetical protein